MRVALVSTHDIDGGAARAAHRLHQALLGAGHNSRMFVQYKSDPDPSVDGATGVVPRSVAKLRWRLDQLPASAAGTRRGEFAVNWLRGSLRQRIDAFAPDVVHLHWVNAGFVSLAEMAGTGRPVVMTAHDMWPFTGGCHYDSGCGRYSDGGCRPCPLQTRQAFPLAAWRLAAKGRVYARGNLSFVTPSRWMASVAQRSPATRQRPVHVIPNAIDLNRFKAIDRKAARALFQLPQDKVVVLFGAARSDADPRKGFALLEAALRDLRGHPLASKVALCVFGSASSGTQQLHDIPVTHVGHLSDEVSLIALYSAADVFVAPSLQDNLPNTVLEATACSLPSVAFRIGGMADLIDDGVSGLLAEPGQASSLAACLLRAADATEWRAGAGSAARQRAEALYGYPVVAAAHEALYRQMLKGAR